MSDWSSDVCSSDLRGINADSIRFMRDVYPPRITLDFKLVGAAGNVLAQGTRELSDIAYLQRGSPLADSDQLRYAKRMIDDWLTLGSSSCRDRVCKYVSISVVAASLTIKLNKQNQTDEK